MEYKLTAPCTAADLAPLRAGDTVLLSGVVYTARDQAHKRMMEALDAGEALPPERLQKIFIESFGGFAFGRADKARPVAAGCIAVERKV